MYDTLRITIMHLFACVLFWMWMAGVALGYGFMDRDRWSLWVSIQAYAVPKIALTLTFPGRLFFDETAGAPWLLIILLLNSLSWAALIVAARAWLKRRRLAGTGA